MLSPRQFRLALLLLAAVCVVPLTGCVDRKLTIGSDPEGAVVTLNDEEIGRTPVTVPFVWYGDYDVVLRYEKNVGTVQKPDIRRYYLHTHKHTKAPVFETIPLDLFVDVLPFTFTDQQIWAFPVPEVQEPADADVIQRARDLKMRLDAPEPLRNEKKAATTRPATAPASH